MRIAYLLGSLNRGGTETLLLDVFRNVTNEQLNAFCIYRKSGVLEEDFLKSGVTMHKLRTGKNIFLYLLRLRKLIIINKTDIVHAQQPIDALLAFLACIFLKTKIVLTLHAYDYTETAVSKIILKYILKKTDLNIYVSDSQCEYYIQKYKLKESKQVTVYNGIDFKKLETDKSSEIRKKLNISNEVLLMGTVGNFVPGRDQITICKFLNLLHQNAISFQFVFIGKRNDSTPERYDDCVDYINANNLSDKVHFLGSRNDVPEILQELDAFVYSTEHDTFGIAVVEAMACGLPVFVNDWDVMKEITDNGNLATLYKTRDERDLFRQFSLFLQDSELKKNKTEHIKLSVRQKFSVDSHISNLKKIYSTL